MKNLAITLLLMIGVLTGNATVTFIGNTQKVITEKPENSTGLNDVYILYNTVGINVQYTAKSNNVTWYKFSNLGGAYAEPISGIQKNGKTYTMTLSSSDMGYIIEDGTDRYYYWVVNYANHRLQLNSLSLSAEQECDITLLETNGMGEEIKYYSINGQAKTLDRAIELAYNTLAWDEESENYNLTTKTTTFDHLSSTIYTQAPLCNTEFILSGDKFLKTWGEIESVTSPYYKTNAIEATTSAIQELREVDNEKKVETTLGGSAPVNIEFRAVCTDAAIFQEWQFSTDAEFENITLRMNDPIFNYTFTEYGTIYVRFMASNSTGSCEFFSDTYEIFIGESSLDCPNAFSPGASECVNDEWKVSYKSITQFECHIFNRWGIKVAQFNDPSQGWDGYHNGKLAPSGVYYYVIKAEGADGKKYDLKGDINIIRSKAITNSTETPTE